MAFQKNILIFFKKVVATFNIASYKEMQGQKSKKLLK